MANPLRLVRDVARDWIGLMSGGVGLALGFAAKFWSKNAAPDSWMWTACALCLFLAMYRAWARESDRADAYADINRDRGVHHDVVELALSDLKHQVVSKDANMAELEQQLDGALAELAALSETSSRVAALEVAIRGRRLNDEQKNAISTQARKLIDQFWADYCMRLWGRNYSSCKKPPLCTVRLATIGSEREVLRLRNDIKAALVAGGFRITEEVWPATEYPYYNFVDVTAIGPCVGSTVLPLPVMWTLKRATGGSSQMPAIGDDPEPIDTAETIWPILTTALGIAITLRFSTDYPNETPHNDYRHDCSVMTVVIGPPAEE